MNGLTALVVAILFGAGVQLMLRRDVVKLAAGTLLVSNAAVLLLVSAGFGERELPMLPVVQVENVADPLVQAMALTAVVIGFGSTVVLLRIAVAVERTHDTIDLDRLAEEEQEFEGEVSTREPSAEVEP